MQQIDASTNIGHLERRVALLAASSADTGAAREARERSLQHYRSARELAEATGEPAGAIISAMSLLMFDAARFEDDDDLLDQAVDLGTVALTQWHNDRGSCDRSFLSEATMQLAEQHVARYQRSHRVADAAHADALSSEAANCRYSEWNSESLLRQRRRRAHVLRTVALSLVGTEDHMIELDELLSRAFTDNPRTPEMEAIAEMAAVYRCLRSQGEDFQDQYSIACEYADRLEVLVRGGASRLIEFIWSVRSLAIELRIAEWAGWAGLDDQQWLPRLQRAAKLVQERSESERDSEEGFAPSRLQLAEIALIVALRRRERGAAPSRALVSWGRMVGTRLVVRAPPDARRDTGRIYMPALRR